MLLRGLISLVVLLTIILGVASYVMLKYALTPHRMADSEAIDRVKSECPWTAAWVDSIVATGALRDTIITRADGAAMRAHWLRADSPTDRVAVLLHGYKCQGLAMLKVGYMFHHQLGYNILMPDLAAHGKSDGDAIGMGWNERHDVLRWMEVANELFRGDSTTTRMVVMGISMGAAATMCVAGEKQQPYVKAFIEDCGYTSAWDEFASEAGKQFGLPPFPLLYTASGMCKLLNGWSFAEASPLNQVKKCTLPMLFIHGDADDYVPTWMVKPLYEAKPGAKQLWLTPGAEHDRSYNKYHDQYAARVKQFLHDCGM